MSSRSVHSSSSLGGCWASFRRLADAVEPQGCIGTLTADMLAISCLRHRWGQKNRQLGQQTTHVEDCGLGHRTGVQFPAPPPIRFGGNKPLGFTKVRLSGFSYSRRFPRILSVSRDNVGKMWAKIEPAKPSATTRERPRPASRPTRVESSAMPDGAELCVVVMRRGRGAV